jgi:energy-coupling factor transporter ATP-binding protein EcfA2
MVSNQERTHCDSLMRDLASNPAAAARTLEVVRQRIRTAANAFQRLGDALDPGYLADLDLKHTQVKAAQEAATLAADALFTGEPLAHVGSETWRLLWESARLYSNQEAYPNLAFPVTDPGSRCVMCQQALSVESAHRLSRFELFVKDKSKKLEAEALRSYQNGSKDLRSADMTIADINSFIALLRDELGDAELATTVRDFAIRAKWSMRSALRAHTQGKPLVAPALPAFPFQEIEKHDEALKGRIDILAGDANSPARKALKAECEELTDRLWLQVVKDDVIAEIGRRKSIAAIRASQKDTNPIRITTKSTEIAEQLVTNTLRSEFVREVERMGVSNLAIELRKGKSTYGTPQFRVSLVNKPDAKVGDVLSEGEHRCIALAAFLAELATIESRSAIVFDDPVSSLDHLHREAIAERLAAEAKHRQVIVFTHDVAFLFLLNEACANHEAHIGYRTIARGADYAGYCYPDGPSNAQPVERVIEAIQAQLTNQSIQYDRGDQAAWLRTVKLIEQQLRESWERAVEEAVSPVLRRLGSKVNTPGLARLTVITLDDCNSMRAAFGRCSRLLHSTPGSLNPRLPNPTRIQAEIDALRNWYIDVKRRQDAVAESHD